MENEQAENLKKKDEICTILESHAAGRTGSEEILRELQAQFAAVGFVPRKDINNMRTRYHEAVDRFITSIPGLSENAKGKISMENR